MNDRPRQRLRFRIRLSLRALFLFVLIAGIFFAVGRATKLRGAREVTAYLTKTEDRPAFDMQFVAPFVYRDNSIIASDSQKQLETSRQTYYVWFFGLVAKTPFATHHTRTIPQTVAQEWEEVYFPVHSQGKSAVPVEDWRMQYGD